MANEQITLDLLEAARGIIREMKRVKRAGIVKMLDFDFYDLECAVSKFEEEEEHDSYTCKTANCPACKNESAREGINA